MAAQDTSVVKPVLFPDYPHDVKRCSRCKEIKPITEFHRRKKGNDQYRSDKCKFCHNAYKVALNKVYKPKRKNYHTPESWRRRKYNLTEDQYEMMMSQQQGRCLICGKEPTKRRLVVDHNHATGQVRGLLCTRCNTMTGYIECSSPETLANMFKYIKER